MDSTQFQHFFQPPKADNTNMLLMLHGTGGDEHSLLQLAQMIDPAAAILSPRGKVKEGNASRFFRRFGEGNLDLDDLRYRTDELAVFVKKAVEEYGVADRRIIPVGYSNGANVATTLLYRHPDLISGAVVMHGMLPYAPDPLPALGEKPVLLTAGRSDPLIPATQTQALADLLASTGADIELVWHPGGHELQSSEIAAAKKWYLTRFEATQ